MKPTDDKNEKLAGAQIVVNQLRPTTFALAALIFGIAGISSFWFLVMAGLAALCALLVAFMAALFGLISAPLFRKT
jgi:hypothetical protein